MFQMFMERMKPNPEMAILDVGVTNDAFYPESNYFEKMYPYPNRITCAGTEDGSHLTDAFPGLRYVRITPDQPLPFRTAEFDVVFSSATIEHVGSRTAQARFLQEICRVGRSFFVTTPSRWCPIEHHTGLPFLHYLPPALFRAMIRNTRYSYWSKEGALNILTAGELGKLFPEECRAEVKVLRLLGWGSNLIAYGKGGR